MHVISKIVIIALSFATTDEIETQTIFFISVTQHCSLQRYTKNHLWFTSRVNKTQIRARV